MSTPSARRRPATPRRFLAAAISCLAIPLPALHAQLDTALEVRSLPYEKAESGLPVDLTGVVIFSDPPATALFQDETAGTFFRIDGRTPPRPGDKVRVKGVTFPGLYLPGIEDTTFEILGHVGLPEPIPAVYDDLVSGRYHYQRVAVEGVVRSLSADEEGSTRVRMALGSRVIEILVDLPLPEGLDLVDSGVRVSGLAAGLINDRRQLVEPYLRCRDWTEFEIRRRAPVLDAVPGLSPGELLRFDVEGGDGHRVRIAGTVLAAFPSGEIFLRDGDSAVGVRLLSPALEISVGDRVEVAGFPEMDRFSGSLVDAVVVSFDENEVVPPPIAVEGPALFDGSHDSDLVSFAATVGDWYRLDRGGVVVLRVGDRTIQARVPELPDSLSSGSSVEVTGICQVEATRGSQYRSHPETIGLRMRSANDLVIVREPPWWTPRRLVTALVLLGVATILAALWIFVLRRQVSRQTRALRGRIENEAILEERQRIAREFHDTLEQDLAGLTLRLDAATARETDRKRMDLLEGARHLVTRIQTETRSLVSDLRDTHGENAPLDESLRGLCAERDLELAPTIRLDVGELPALPSRTVHHLRMITREAITNVWKHAGAGTVDVRSREENGVLVLEIADDGRGFDVEAETHGVPGHFGCMGIRERARRIGAEVSWKSEPGNGTVVTVRLPLNSRHPDT